MTQLHLVYRRGTPIMGPCCQCGRNEDTEGLPEYMISVPITWRCAACKGFVCRGCTLKKKMGTHMVEYLTTTLCSEECRQAYRVQERMLGHSLEGE